MVVHTNLRNSWAGVFITIASTLKQLKISGEVNIPSFLKQAPTKGQNLLVTLHKQSPELSVFTFR